MIRRTWLPALFALTLTASSALLFLVEPMVARMVLPRLGGTPAVWNTCMVFFQGLLFAGYAYAHAGTARLGARRLAVLHVAVVIAPMAALPLGLPAGWAQPGDVPPVVWLLALLVVVVGAPFFVLSTAAPLLQRWFADTAHPAARDPYFLYVASNVGSMVALLAYPLWIERVLPLSQQQRYWRLGYCAAAGLTIACAIALWWSPRAPAERRPVRQQADRVPLSVARRLRWLLLAFVPSSLMLSVTIFITSDLGAVPLLWVAPLWLYLLSFILVFGHAHRVPQRILARGLPLVIIVVILTLISEATEPLLLLMAIHLLGLLWVATFCHGALAADRPPAAHLTEFYLWMAAGGVAGGVFNALLAPLIFSTVAEYPLVLVIAALLRPDTRASGRARTRDVLLPAALTLATVALVLGWQRAGLEPGPMSMAAMFAVPAIICYTFLEHPLRFGLGVAGLLLATVGYHGVHGRPELRMRSFFGVHRVTRDEAGTVRRLVHGDTVHGEQSLEPTNRMVPLGYYHPSGPIGDVFRALEGDPSLHRVGVAGLGVGELAAYARRGQHWTFFEIDPAVIHIARDSGLFTFLAASAARVEIVRGDARLELARYPGRFDLLILDAFSSDAIPVHLLTREALAVYRSHLAPGGLLAFHISSRYFDLGPVLASLARSADPPLACLIRSDLVLTAEQWREGEVPSVWVAMAEQPARLSTLAASSGWSRLVAPPRAEAWSDERASPLDALRWRK